MNVRNEALDISPVEPYRRRYADMVEVGRDWRRHWREIARWELPRAERWLKGEAGDDENERTRAEDYSMRLVNPIAAYSLRTLTSGIDSGLTPTNATWLTIKPLRDSEENRETDSAVFLSKLTEKVMDVIHASNFRDQTPGFYDDAETFGTSVMLMEDNEVSEDSDSLVNFYHLPAGSHHLACNHKREVDTLYRHFSMTAANMAATFGLDQCSNTVRDAMKQGHPDRRFKIIQAIQPVDPGDKKKPAWAKYESVWFEHARQPSMRGENDRFLDRKYYRVKPFVALRWNSDGDNPYGTSCPGMDVLGTCRQLASMEKKKLKAIDQSIDPALVVNEVIQGGLKRSPGKVNYVKAGEEAVVRPLHAVNYDIASISNEIANVVQNIGRAFYDLYLISFLTERKQMTATESANRIQEKNMVMGPVIARFEFEFLTPVIVRIIDALFFHNLIPPPPESLGSGVKFKFIGPLAQEREKLKLINLQAFNEATGTIAGMTQNPAIFDRIDFDQEIEIFQDVLNVPPSILIPYREAEAKRTRQAQAAQRAQAAAAAIEGAKTLSQTPLGQNTMLDQVVEGGGAPEMEGMA